MIQFLRRRLLSKIGLILTIVGLGLVGGYFGFILYAEGDLEEMNQIVAMSPAPTATAELTVSPTEGPATPEQPTATPTPEAPAPSALRIVIPAINVDAPVVEVGILQKDGKSVWETADHAVGHHSNSLRPGEGGNIVMSGHIRHPREGNVFARLPDIPGMLERGEVVTVTLYTADAQYDYRVVETKVVEPTELSVLDPTPEETLTLITCVPDWVFDHRLVVICKRTA